MRDRAVCLQLATAITALFDDSGATQVEQVTALAIARELVPFTPNAAIEAPAEGSPPASADALESSSS